MSTTQPWVHASFRVAEGHGDEVREVLDGMVVATRQEPGCLRYDLFEDEEGDLHLVEAYADADALQAHRDSEHYRAYRARITDLLRAPIEVTVLSPRDVAMS